MMRLRVLDHLALLSREPPDKAAGARIVDNAILPGEEKQDWDADVLRHEPKVAVEPNALDQQPGRRLSEPQWVIADKALGVRRGGEQGRVVERDRKEPARRHEPRRNDA